MLNYDYRLCQFEGLGTICVFLGLDHPQNVYKQANLPSAWLAICCKYKQTSPRLAVFTTAVKAKQRPHLAPM